MAEVKMPQTTQVLDPSNLPGNSDKQKKAAERPKQKSVVQGNVKVKKPGLGRKFADAFLGEDVIDVKSYILQDVLIPAVKGTIVDIIGGGVDTIEMALFGRVSGNRRRGSNLYPRQGPYTAYGTAYSNPNNQTGRAASPVRNRAMDSYGVQDVIFGSRTEAMNVLDAMRECMDQYDGMVSVSDFYDLAGVQDRIGGYTDQLWGWMDLSTATIRHVRDGWTVLLPRPVSLR